MSEPLSKHWARRHHDLLGRTTDDATRLAIGLGIVKAAVRVVDRTMPPLSVDWASVKADDDEKRPIRSMSYTNFEDHSIHINPVPMLDTRIGHSQALDVVIGFGLHEASHSQESRNRYQHLIIREATGGKNGDGSPEYKTRPAFEPMRVAAWVWNLVEDSRIEKVTGDNWPGFRPYFGGVLDYMWVDVQNEGLPTQYGPELKDKLKVAFLACRYPTRWKPKKLDLTALSEHGIRKVRSSKDDVQRVKEEVAWWSTWQADYLAGRTDTPETIQRALDHLREDEQTAEEMDAETERERAERQAGERLKAQLDRLISEGVAGTYEICINENGEVRPLDAELSAAVNKLVREELTEHKLVITESGMASAPLYERKPEESRESIRAYIGRPDAEAEALRAALVFRNSAPQYDEKLLKTGSAIDDEEIWRAATGDFRVFTERVIEAKPDVFMGLLVDLSGSMSGPKLKIAQRLAQLFVWAVHDQETIETAVWGHTADTGRYLGGSTIDVFRLWERGDPISRLGLISELDHSNNADGHAIAHVARWIADNATQPEKVLVVLSDGLPNAHGYGGTPAQQHVRQVCRWAQSHGVQVVQLAIDPSGIRPADQSAMFGEGNWMPFTSYAALPRQITALLSRYL